MEEKERIIEFRTVIRQISRRVEFESERKSAQLFPGSHRSIRRGGGGMEFETYLPYEEGKDPRTIDWKASQRTGQLVTKERREERQMPAILLVDLSPSMEWGYRERKLDLSVKAAAVISFISLRNGDQVGIIGFDATIRSEFILPPTQRRSMIIEFLKRIWLFKPFSGTETDLSFALKFLFESRRNPCIIFLVSDFIALKDFENSLGIVANRHDLMPVMIRDPREQELPDVGLVKVRSTESGEEIILDTASPVYRERFHRLANEDIKEKIRMFKDLNLDYLFLSSEEDYFKKIVLLLGRREKRT